MAQNVPFTNQALFKIYNEEGELERFIFSIKMKRWLNEFRNDNGLRFNKMMKERIALQKEFFEFEKDKDGNEIIKMEIKKTTKRIHGMTMPDDKRTWIDKNIFRKKAPVEFYDFRDEVKEETCPAMLEGKRIEEYNKKYEEWAKEEKTISI